MRRPARVYRNVPADGGRTSSEPPAPRRLLLPSAALAPGYCPRDRPGASPRFALSARPAGTARRCAAGKDVFVEKPLTHNISEGPAVIEAQRRHQRTVQVGTQQRSMPPFIQAREIVRASTTVTTTIRLANRIDRGIENPDAVQRPAARLRAALSIVRSARLLAPKLSPRDRHSAMIWSRDASRSRNGIPSRSMRTQSSRMISLSFAAGHHRSVLSGPISPRHSGHSSDTREPRTSPRHRRESEPLPARRRRDSL